MMKNVLHISLFAILLVATAFGQKEFGKITLPLGRVQVQKGGSGNFNKATMRMIIHEKDIVKTLARSRCEITLVSGGKLRIGENSELEITKAEVKPMEKSFGANLKTGDVWVAAKAVFGEKKNVSIRTPTAVAAIRGTVFRIDCDNNQSTINVYTGMVDVSPLKEDGITPEDTTFTVEAGEKFVIVKNLEEYLEQEKKALQQFNNKEENDFNAFLKRELEEFNGQLQEEKTKFKLYKSLSMQKSKIDTGITQLSEWINWNKERDLLIK